MAGVSRPVPLRSNLAGVRGVLATLAFSLGWAAAACSSTFACEEDSQCDQDGAAGVCQPATGFCSFPSDDCESGQQYGELAPDGLAGTCVPLVEDTESPTSDGGDTTGTPDPGTDSGTTGSSVDSTTMSVDPDTSATDSTTGSGSEDSSDEGSSGDSSSGGMMACCGAGCPDACQPGAMCNAMLVGADPPQNSEAIGVAVVGDQVIWSTGFGRSLMIADPAMGIDEELVAVPENTFVTRIAADDSHVYFVDWGGPVVRRVSVDGVVDLVTVVPMGQAGFGGIAVNDSHVYFSMRTSGDVWRAAKDLSDQDGAEHVATADNPFGVALDDAYLFYIDSADAQVRRIALDEIGADDSGTTVLTAMGLSAIAVDDDALYYGASGQLGRADKLGTNEGLQNLGNDLGNIWNIDLDETHAYYTGSTENSVGRVLKDGSSPVEILATTPNPWGLALGCTDIYWAENGTQTLQRMLK